jgi:hypothetical protein
LWLHKRGAPRYCDAGRKARESLQFVALSHACVAARSGVRYGEPIEQNRKPEIVGVARAMPR